MSASQDDLRAHAAAASDFESVPTIHHATHIAKAPGLEVTLHRGAQRIVHQELFGFVQQHRSLALIVRRSGLFFHP
jgi:hypothetical protein